MINSKLMKSIDEVKYLSAENTWRYRPIIRIFYKNYEKMKYWLYKEDIFEELKRYEEFKDYTLDNLKYDLDTLVENKNLLTLQDTSKVKTIEEFKNKQFRYQLSDYTVEIERMVIRLERLSTENHGSLEATLIERFKENLERLGNIKYKDSKEINDWWRALNNDFKNLNENYQDYIRGFYSPKAEELMQTTEFLIFKERLIKYLREFIKELQLNAFRIEKLLAPINIEEITEIILRVLEYEKTIPRLDYTIDEGEFIETNLGRWKSINDWFISKGNGRSDCEKLLDFTNEIIMKITRYAAQISERRNSSANRKMEYRKLLKLFYSSRDIEEAGKLSALTIGLFNMRHIRGNSIRETESINSSIYEEKPHEIVIKPRVKTYRERNIKNPIKDKGDRKAELQRELMENRQKEREVIEALIVDGTIDFSRLPEITSFQRHTLLRWLSKGNNNKSSRGRTEYGGDYEIVKISSENIRVMCEDGEFTMPHFILKFH